MTLVALTMEKIKNLSRKYSIPKEDIILIALNCLGVRTNIPNKRIRFQLKLDTISEIFYLAICVNTGETPFLLKNNQLFFNNKRVGMITDRENDTCDSTYFRRNKTVLTLNSNSRSKCRGCKFCGTYNQDAEDINNLLYEDKLAERFKEIIKQNNFKDLSGIDEIGLCTGCFKNEEKTLEHLIMMRKVAKQFNFKKEIKYIGSQIVSEGVLGILRKHAGMFSLYLTIECFTRRESLLRPPKAQLNLETAKQTLGMARDKGFNTAVLYILGLDPLVSVLKGFENLKPYFSRFPVINVFQNYFPEQELLRIKEAKDMEYYLEARKGLEKIFADTNLRPHPWESYRSLWYLTFNGDKIKDIRI